ncbi:MAG TPA: metal-dependent transcriptional regulator [Hungateiclostridium thermocellum]|uniref:Iron (Metal) dependent repressor, DtxR family n=2 Tax=Acetivibrio thermocellus TaxID=1515 RepID=A3DD26_ACET2|nr:metal-dependent transcriptional regulator [Acetivibrio thermocellus]CDG35311.1 DtxR family iron dependent repressor [Acetivibrio thermocellus BC1]ABN51855.1 iron (metal) dependent repressor, DtxR family [Acetivibrio thermocellus ATCC 27405]ADU74669.1 iron (metal) dependent repressor, DtxR family [Acetivibrio thermocellus DSM 1313]ALX08612.1 iron (metal) dependent repressor, DtxR family [Acetivibrio thermocellus AD2]ANV76361.1 iron (metal) dependent repressor, DtxR family [Acetivibrio thermo
MKIQESAENYLETILILRQRIGQVRSIDIVNEMNFSKPSISYAMKQLRENGYISMDESGYITLTEKGLEIAERVYERHKVLTDYLVSLGVDEDVAKADACRIEHVISPMSFEMIKKAYKEILENKQAKKE